MSPLGLAVAGPVADLVGISFWYLLSGAVLTVAGVGAFLVPAIRHLEDRRPTWADAQDEAIPASKSAID